MACNSIVEYNDWQALPPSSPLARLSSCFTFFIFADCVCHLGRPTRNFVLRVTSAWIVTQNIQPQYHSSVHAVRIEFHLRKRRHSVFRVSTRRRSIIYILNQPRMDHIWQTGLPFNLLAKSCPLVFLLFVHFHFHLTSTQFHTHAHESQAGSPDLFWCTYIWPFFNYYCSLLPPTRLVVGRDRTLLCLGTPVGPSGTR